MTEVMNAVLEAAGAELAVVVKMNMRDGFHGGLELDEAIQVARLLESLGVNGLVLSGGFVSKAPMYVMRGSMPVKVMAHYMGNPMMRFGTRYFGDLLMKPEPFSEGYFLNDALKIRNSVGLPLIYVGGLKSLDIIEKVLAEGFDFVQIARALIHDPRFVNKLKSGEVSNSGCQSSNYCIARMYSGKMVCFQNDPAGSMEMNNKFSKKNGL